uniref:4Fe-4S ferredoxin-type domain-containing protein n=1 Tax=Leersia perrieri TaxID=77586 RepID=A0A0D9WEJ5_9ORYZ
MAKITAFLLFALVVSTAATATAVPVQLPVRRSRFLLATNSLLYSCSKKSSAVCLAEGSPGATCCGGRCVDTITSGDHCGGCNKACKHGRTCCGGSCVDLLSDRDNCGSCSSQCSKKCYYGFCDYA